MELECRLATIRYRYGRMTQQRLSELTGIGINKISGYENNKVIMSVPTLYLIARAIGCNPGEIYKEKDRGVESLFQKRAAIKLKK